MTLNGQAVGASGSRQEHPTAAKTYELAATWVDDSVTTRRVPVNLITVCAPKHERDLRRPARAERVVTLLFRVANATGVAITGVRFLIEAQGPQRASRRRRRATTTGDARQPEPVSGRHSASNRRLCPSSTRFKPHRQDFLAGSGFPLDYTVNGFIPVHGQNLDALAAVTVVTGVRSRGPVLISLHECGRVRVVSAKGKTVAKIDAGKTLLTYSLVTSPSPLQASPSAVEQSLATLTFVVSCPHNLPGANVAQILISTARSRLAGSGRNRADRGRSAGIGRIDRLERRRYVDVRASPARRVSRFVPRRWRGPGILAGPDHRVHRYRDQPAGRHGRDRRQGMGLGQRRSTEPPHRRRLRHRGTINVAKFPSGFHVSDFRASSQLVDAGGTVVLSWVGSPDATYTLRYDHTEVPVTQVRDWPSPPLYATTVFVLHASATQNGETVGTDRSITIEVAAPQVVSCETSPDVIGYGGSFELKWRAIDADGVYLITGNLSREVLPPVSDDKTPKRITPKLGAMYFLRAFRRRRRGNPLGPLSGRLHLPAADDQELQGGADLRGCDDAVSIALVGDRRRGISDAGRQTGPPVKGTQSESPTIATNYELGAVWVNGEVTNSPWRSDAARSSRPPSSIRSGQRRTPAAGRSSAARSRFGSRRRG